VLTEDPKMRTVGNIAAMRIFGIKTDEINCEIE
jgi:hypothetical protein